MTSDDTSTGAPTLAQAIAEVLAQMPDPSGGSAARHLENELARAFDIPHAVTTSCGTAALHAALSACGIGPGDEVLLPALTVVMSAAPVVALGATPVFVDSDPATVDLDFDDAARKVTAHTKAIMPVHLWGRMGSPDTLLAFAAEHGLAVVEDAAQAAGTTRQGRRAGTVGDVGCFSMKDGKILWSGEGGFLLTRSHEIAQHAAAFRSHWQDVSPGQKAQSRIATNCRLAAPLAAIASSNLRRLPALLEHRRAQTRQLHEHTAHVRGLQALPPPANGDWNSFAALFRIDLPRPRAFAEHLARSGVPNSTGSFGLVPCDARPMFLDRDRPPCASAAQILDHTLAVIVTERDSPAQLERYATTIRRAVHAWQP